MKKIFSIIGLTEVPLKDQSGDEMHYILSVHLHTFYDLNEAEEKLKDLVMTDKVFEFGFKIETTFIKK